MLGDLERQQATSFNEHLCPNQGHSQEAKQILPYL